MCIRHKSYFTVYPLGWQPFGRRPTIPLTPNGDEIGFGSFDLAWSRTCFRAVVDAANGIKWPTSYRKSLWKGDGDPPGVFRTQCRHIAGVQLLFGLVLGHQKDQEDVVLNLGIALADLVRAEKIRDGPDRVWQAWGGGDYHLLRTLGMPRRHMLTPLNRLGRKREFWGDQKR